MRVTATLLVLFVGMVTSCSFALAQGFQLVRTYQFGSGFVVYAGDLNGDHYGDYIAISGRCPESTYVMSGLTDTPICPGIPGRVEEQYFPPQTARGGVGSPVVDVTGDGIPEFYSYLNPGNCSGGLNALQMIEPTTGQVVFSLSAPSGSLTAIGVVDVDGDGTLELLIGSSGPEFGSIRAYTLPQLPTSAPGIVDPADAKLPAPRATLAEVKRHGTAIDYELNLPRDEDVRVDIFDATGKQVCHVIDGKLSSGRNVFSWNGRAADDKLVASGVYLVRVYSGGTLISTKACMVR